MTLTAASFSVCDSDVVLERWERLEQDRRCDGQTGLRFLYPFWALQANEEWDVVLG